MPVNNISIQEFLEMSAGEEIELIDVREEYEHRDGHIKNSRNIPMGILPLKLEEIDFSKKVVLYCRSGARSMMVARSIDDGKRDLYNLDGGMIVVERESPEVVE